jgi:hypothetical protein
VALVVTVGVETVWVRNVLRGAASQRAGNGSEDEQNGWRLLTPQSAIPQKIPGGWGTRNPRSAPPWNSKSPRLSRVSWKLRWRSPA